MHKTLIATSLVLAATAFPAFAGPNCEGVSPGGGVHISMGITIGEFSEAEQNQFDLMNLRRLGVDATRVERWGGCLRAFVRQPGGGEQMEFYHPRTFERVY